MKVRIAEVSYENAIDEYEVVAEDNIQARDLLTLYLRADTRRWKRIRVRDTPRELPGPARVIGRRV
jgi:hypothetical protein